MDYRSMNYKKVVLIIIIFSLIILSFVATYAMFTANARGSENALGGSAASFDLALDVKPQYYFDSLIPMDDDLAVTGYNNGCVDKNNYNVCQAYKINLANVSETGQTERFLGDIIFSLTDIQNLKYMVLDENGEVYQNITLIEDGVNLSLGDYVELTQDENKELTLIIWVSNLEGSQNDLDANGSFSASLTYTGISGESLSSAITGVIN